MRTIAFVTSVLTLLTAIVEGAPLVVLIPVLVAAGTLAMSWNGLAFAAAAEVSGRARSGVAIGLQQSVLNGIGAAYPPLFGALVAVTAWRYGFAASPCSRSRAGESCEHCGCDGRRAPRGDLRDRTAPGGLLGRGGRRARARGGLDAGSGARGLARRCRQPLRAAGRGESVGGIASRQRSDRRPLRRRARRRRRDRGGAQAPGRALAVVAFRAEETGPMGSKRLAELPDAYLELHIEQGPVLALAGAAARHRDGDRRRSARCEAVFEGRADHAGTTPMDARADALVDAAHFILHVRECARDGTVATVGVVEVEPNAINVVPARVTVSVDARSPDAAQLDALVQAIGFEPAHRLEPAQLSDAFDAVLPDAPRLVSGAGHDAMVLALAGVPSSMLFVRSLNGGISHHPDELSSDEDIALAVDALTAALSRLVS